MTTETQAPVDQDGIAAILATTEAKPTFLPYYLTDRLDYSGTGSQWRWLLRTMDERHGDEGTAEAGFSLDARTIYGRTPALLARMRRIVALYVRLLGDLDGGFSNLASDEHLCVECYPTNWSYGDLIARDMGPIPWELSPEYNRACQIIRHSGVLNVMEARPLCAKVTVDLRTALTPEAIIGQIRDHLYGIGTERYALIATLEQIAQDKRAWVGNLAGFIGRVDEEPGLDVTWVHDGGVRWR